MEDLYYGTDEFAVLEFQNRRVIDEIKMSMTAFDCMLPDNAGIYCSTDLTSGKRFYYELLKRYGVRSEDELRKKLGDEEYKKVKDGFMKESVKRGVEFAEQLRERGRINVVTPGPFYAEEFGQPHYLYLWEWFIIKKIYEIRLNNDWEYSNGCTLECAIGAKKRIPLFDHEGNLLDLKTAIGKVEAAIEQLGKDGFATPKLEENLARMKAIEL